MILAYYPSAKLKLAQEYQELVKLAHDKLYFEAFMHEEVLEKLGIVSTLRGEAISYENKFNPVILPRSALKIDPDFRQHEFEGPKRRIERTKFEGMPSKKVKISNEGSTPVSLVSCEESTCKY